LLEHQRDRGERVGPCRHLLLRGSEACEYGFDPMGPSRTQPRDRYGAAAGGPAIDRYDRSRRTGLDPQIAEQLPQDHVPVLRVAGGHLEDDLGVRVTDGLETEVVVA